MFLVFHCVHLVLFLLRASMNSSIYQATVITHAIGMHTGNIVTNFCLGVPIGEFVLRAPVDLVFSYALQFLLQTYFILGKFARIIHFSIDFGLVWVVALRIFFSGHFIHSRSSSWFSDKDIASPPNSCFLPQSFSLTFLPRQISRYWFHTFIRNGYLIAPDLPLRVWDFYHRVA
jgi:hypothetical protein